MRKKKTVYDPVFGELLPEDTPVIPPKFTCYCGQEYQQESAMMLCVASHLGQHERNLRRLRGAPEGGS